MTTRPGEYHLMMVDVISNALRDEPDHVPDMIDFAWWNNEQLHDFISDTTKVAQLNEDDYDALVTEVAKRVGAKIRYEDSEGPSSAT